MPTRSDINYFGAGPALLPTDVLEDAAKALLNYSDTGLGIAEHSHRSEIATTVINEAKADLAFYLDIPDNYEILFMQGGGSAEFSAHGLPANTKSSGQMTAQCRSSSWP